MTSVPRTTVRPMAHPDWHDLDLDVGVLPEPVSDQDRVVLWLPGSLDGGFRHWERIGTVPGAEVSAEQGLGATAATSVRARQPRLGWFGKFLQKFRKPPG